MDGFFVKDRTFYRSFLTLGLTLMLEQAVVLLVNLADNLMIGSYSEVALSGVAAVNQLQFFVQQTANGITAGVVILAGQYWGDRQTGPIRSLISLGLRVGLGFAAAMLLLTSLAPAWCVGLFVKDDRIIAEGVRYLSVLRISFPFFVVTTVLLGALRSVESVKVALRVSALSLVVNCSINFVLIQGRFGAPELGVTGAAIGTVTARILECVIVAYYVLRRDKKLGLRLKDLRHTDRQLNRDYVRVASPAIAQESLWGISTALQTAILGHITAGAMAAYSISSTAFLLLKVAARGACTAASILTAKQIGGGGSREELRQYVRTMQVLFLGIGLVLSAAMFLIRIPLLSAYKIAPATYEMANAFILIQCMILLTMSYQMPCNAGILRGGGDTRFGIVLDLAAIWAFVLPLSFLAAFVWELSPVVVVMCLNADQVFKCIPIAIRLNRYRWVRRLTRTETN